jgi:uncharacterized protein YecT (DUF1311 family)
MKLRIAFALAAAFALCISAGAQERTGTLADCMKRHPDPGSAATCIRLAQRQASDEMLEAFEATQRRIRALDGGDGALAAALTESQRDFERYVQGQCTFVHAVFARAGIADWAALACETDLLLQRTAALRPFAGIGNTTH